MLLFYLMKKKIKTSIIGATGYTGLEVIRYLLSHPNVEINHISGSEKKEENLSNLFPHLSHLNLKTSTLSSKEIAEDSDCVFLSLPHGESYKYIKEIKDLTKIIDLSADLRLKENLHKKYYPEVPFDSKLFSEFTYGFIEKEKENIKKANNIANPGCFALCSQLCILPFKDLATDVDIFAITGSSGGGKKPSEGAHHPIRSHNLFSYNINVHRHMGEIYQSYPDIRLNFIPSSGPFVRGIFVNAFIKLKKSISKEEIKNILHSCFHQSKFVFTVNKVCLANVTGSNFFNISAELCQDEKSLVVQGCLDNLGKGASGNAVQCMNLMFDFEENAGLNNINVLYP